MLIEQLQPYFEAQPQDYDCPAMFYLTLNRTTANNTWSAGYQDFRTGKILLGVNNCETLDEVAMRLRGRLNRQHRIYHQLRPPRTLHDMPERATVEGANIMEGLRMADNDKAAKLSHGQTLVGLRFNPSKDDKVDALKQHAADMIDIIEDLNATEGHDPDSDLLREYAVQAILTAQMAAVKRATWNLAKNAPQPAANSTTGTAGADSLPVNTGGNTADPLDQKQAGSNGPATGDAATSGPAPGTPTV